MSTYFKGIKITCLVIFTVLSACASAAAPTLSRNSPTATVNIAIGSSVTFKANAADTDGNLTGSEWYGNGDDPFMQYVSHVGGNGSSATFSRTHTFNTIGTFNISVVAFDTDYQYSTSVAWTVNVVAAAPTISIDSPASSVNINVGDSVTFQADAADVEGNLSGSEWYGNGDDPFLQYISHVGGNGNSATFSRTHTFNTTGSFTITALAFDTNNEYSSSVAWTVNVTESSGNTAPTVSFNHPSQANYTINAGDTVTFKVNATDLEGNISGSEWYGNGDNPFVQYLSGASGDGDSAVFSRTHTFPSSGTYKITVLVFDTDSAYSTGLVWNVTVNGTTADYSSTPPSQLGERALYVNSFDNVLASTAATDKLLAHIQSHNITKLTVYNLHTQLPSKSAEISDFICKAKHLGVTSVGAAGGGEFGFDLVMQYQDNAAYPHKFDTLYLEYEYWNEDPDVSRFLELLDYMDTVGGDMPVEAYVGWLNPGDAPLIANRLDNLFLHCYTQNPTTAFNYCRARLQEFGEVNIGLNIWPIFSAEWRPQSTCDNPPWEPEALCFMGDWFEHNGVAAAENQFMNAYNADSGAWKAGINLPGFHYFAYSFLDEAVGSPQQPTYSNPPACGGPVPTLSLNNPAASITVAQGATVTFTANGVDGDGNLRGAEWYGNSDNPHVQYIENVGGNGSAASFSRTHTFNTVGTVTVSVVAFDTESNYSSVVSWQVTVQ